MQKFITSWCYHIQSTTNHGSILARKYWKLSKLDNLKLYIYLLCFSSLERLQEEFFFVYFTIWNKYRRSEEKKIYWSHLAKKKFSLLFFALVFDWFASNLETLSIITFLDMQKKGKSNKKFSRFFFFFGTLNVIVLLTKFLFFSCCS